ncbi:hypothetical protein EST38_g5381 [Candolleomyces aberdarensis]|uniref:Uncharacterized protein n=1 Tax=Candolleomyces aberdarensis TaxID=2316362 RepID=A0A4Q2DND2_9AGAR|nr:hypothetical protein EST38_g5381 [Candolleomyces aberdarensis]
MTHCSHRLLPVRPVPGLQLCQLPHRTNPDSNPSLSLRMPQMWLRNANLNTNDRHSPSSNDRASNPDSAYATDNLPS